MASTYKPQTMNPTYPNIKQFAPGPPRAVYVPKKEAPKETNPENITKMFDIVRSGSITEIRNAISIFNTPLNIQKDSKSLIHYVLENKIGIPENDKLELIQYLLEHGASLSFDKYNVCPLHLACKYQYKDIVEFLLKIGDVNVCDSNGMNALHYLVQGDIDECKTHKKVKKIIEHTNINDTITSQLKIISDKILNITNKKDFKQYFDHIKYALTHLNIFYYDNYDEETLFKDIGDKIIDITKSDNEKNNIIEDLVNGYIIKLKKNMENIFNDTIKDIDANTINNIHTMDVQNLIDTFYKEKNIGDLVKEIDALIVNFSKHLGHISRDINISETEYAKNNKGKMQLEILNKKNIKNKDREYPELDIINSSKGGNITTNGTYAYASEIIYWIKEMEKVCKTVNDDIIEITTNITISPTNYSNVYTKIVNTMMTKIFNIIQYSMMVNEISKQLTALNTKELKDMKFLDDIKHYKISRDIYKYCREFIEKFNKIITIINNVTYNIFIEKITDTFITDSMDYSTIVNIFNMSLKQIQSLPDMNQYIEEISGKSLDEQKMYLYKKYFHSINPNYLLKYINGTKDVTGRKGYLMGPIKNEKGSEVIIDIKKRDKIILPYDYDPNAVTNFNALDNTNTNTKTYKIGDIAIKKDFGINNQQKCNADIYPVGNYLNDYIYHLKIYLIKHILDKIKLNINIKNDFYSKLNSFYSQITNKQKDELFVTHIIKISNQIISAFIKNSIYESINLYAVNFTKTSKPFKCDNIKIRSIDVKYSFDFNEILENILESFKNSHLMKNQNLFPLNLIESESNVDLESITNSEICPLQNLNQKSKIKQFKIYDSNYKMTKQLTLFKCYNINLDIIDLLYNNFINMNKKDSTGSSPLFYALETGNKELIRKLLFCYPIISVIHPSIKNNLGVTPYKHFINLYKTHILHVYNPSLNSSNTEPNTIRQLVDKLTTPIFNEIKENIQSDSSKYKNNILRYLDIIFPQLIIMYNNMLYFYAKSYSNNWTYDNNEQLKLLLCGNTLYDEQYKLPIVNNFNKDVLNKSIKFNYVVDSKNKNIKQIKKKQEKRKALVNVIDSLRKELATYTNLRNSNINLITRKSKYDYVVNQITIKLSYVISQRNMLDKEMIALQQANNNIDINKEKTDLGKMIDAKIKKLHIEGKYLQHNLVSVQHDEIFNDISTMYTQVFNNGICYKQQLCNDYILYNELWKDLIHNNKNLDNISNIHLKIVDCSIKLFDDMDKITHDNCKDAKNIYDKFKLLSSFCDKILVKTLNSVDELPLLYDYQQNYILAETLDIITHVVKHTLCANLYYTVVKITAKYLIELNKNFMTGPKKLRTDIYNKLENSKLMKDLQQYILDKMPKLLVKKTLNIYEDDFEKDNINISNLFSKITTIITLNSEFPMPKESTLVVNLEGPIFDYFKNIFGLVIPLMQTVIDNYNRLILNDCRFIKIAKLLNKHVKDLKF
jgi:hypothetical protein